MNTPVQKMSESSFSASGNNNGVLPNDMGKNFENCSGSPSISSYSNPPLRQQMNEQSIRNARVRLDYKKSFHDDPFFYFENKVAGGGTNNHNNNHNHNQSHNNGSINNMGGVNNNPYRTNTPNQYLLPENVKLHMNGMNNSNGAGNNNNMFFPKQQNSQMLAQSQHKDNLLSVLAQKSLEKQHQQQYFQNQFSTQMMEGRKNEGSYQQQQQQGDPYLNNNQFGNNYLNMKSNRN